MPYAELHSISNFTFLRGASWPGELVATAAELNYQAIAICDECSLAGIVKAHLAAKANNIKLIVGSEFTSDEFLPQLSLVLLAPTRSAYEQLSALITRARRRSEKGSYTLLAKDLEWQTQHLLAIWLPNRSSSTNELVIAQGQWLKKLFAKRLWLGVSQLLKPGDHSDYLWKYQLATTLEIPMLACGNVHMHSSERKPLQDILTAIRLNTPVQKLGTYLQSNSEQRLRPISTLQKLYPKPLLEEACRLASLCTFSLDELRYEYPEELVPAELTATEYLLYLVQQGAATRWPKGVPQHIQKQIDHELTLIKELSYEYYFLTVYDIVYFARSNNILCQGRGSAANSVVCYCLYITEVSPEQTQLLFERFISKERNEPPDIDVDFEHERREEVIQYLYKKYGRNNAALTATVITYRPRSAIRDVGKALGLDDLFVDQLAKSLAWRDRTEELTQRFNDASIGSNSKGDNTAENNKAAQQFVSLVKQILGFPRHLSQHVGGFLITNKPLHTIVPVENASMKDRTVIQWDKEDINALGLLKIDILALGMLSAIRKCFDLVTHHYRTPLSMATIPPEDPKTYAMLCRGDSIGLFQVESRAQISMLPRLKPQTYYDLVIQVAIVRPGPIQGDMVHPYLRRRQKLEPVTYPSPDIEQVLKRTLGVPIFQEQVIKIAMVAAGFSGGEADQLRRAMASWGHNGNLLSFEEKLLTGMRDRGYSEDFSQRLFKQIQGFGEYGFPESHAASFALLVYVSAWLKCHYPAAFYCALLNSQPMGFYSPSQLIQDAKRHSIEVKPITIEHSSWDHSLEDDLSNNNEPQPSLRLGFRAIKGFNKSAAQRLIKARAASFSNLKDLAVKAQLNKAELAALINADATKSINEHRYQGHWQQQAIETPKPLLSAQESTQSLDDEVFFIPPDEFTNTVSDYNTTGLSLQRHPLAQLRHLKQLKPCTLANQLCHLSNGRFVRVSGLVTGRQRPGSASGVIFMTLEDETGNINVIVWKATQQNFRQPLMNAKLVVIYGTSEYKDGVAHVIAGRIIDYSHFLNNAQLKSRDFH
jgi:error-prone DNA polymerase